jgi:protein-disulfide isomerase
MPDVVKLVGKEKELRLVMKEFPILGPGSTYAARAAIASRQQGKYWEFHQALYSHEGRIDEAAVDQIAASLSLDMAKLKADMKAPKVDEVIANNMKLAETLNIQGTPAFIVDETVIPGAVGYEALTAAVDQVRETGCKIC